MQISIQDDIARLGAIVDQLADKQIRFAISRALNDVAAKARDHVKASLPTIFDRPTPFTQNSVAIVTSSREHLISTVLIKDRQAQYLALEETGGVRTPGGIGAPSVAALTLPGVAARLNQFGNLPQHFQATLRRAAAADAESRRDLHVAVTTTLKEKQRRARRKVKLRDRGVFYSPKTGPHGNGPGGYFMRLPGHRLTRLTGFESTETYRPRFGFHDLVSLVAKQAFPKAFVQRLQEAVASAR